MKNTWIGRRIRRSNRTWLIWGAFFCACALGLGSLGWRSAYNLFRGPFPIDLATLSKIRRPEDRLEYYVAFEVEKTAPTGFGIKSKNNPDPHTEYVIAIVEGRALLIRKPSRQEGNAFTGTLAAPTPEERTMILAKLEADVPGLRGAFLPYVMNAQPRQFVSGVISWMIPLGLVFGLGLWMAGKGVVRTIWPSRHPIARALGRFGPPGEIAAAIEEEVGARGVLSVGSVDFLGRWLLCRAPFRGFQVFRIDDLVWAHKSVVRVNGVPHFWAKLHDRDRKSFSVQSSEQKIDALLTAILTQAPWVIAGYDARLEETWKTNPAELIEAVGQRRAQYLAGQAGALL